MARPTGFEPMAFRLGGESALLFQPLILLRFIDILR